MQHPNRHQNTMSSDTSRARISMQTTSYVPVKSTICKKKGAAQKLKRAAKTAANKKIKYEALIADMSNPEEQKDMETSWDQVGCALTKRVYRNVAVCNYMKYEMRMSDFYIKESTQEEEIFSKMISSPGGYFYYKNLMVGVRKYGIVNSVQVDESTVDYIVKTWGQDTMMMWIKFGFQ